jgi:hypothetical protein
MRGPVLSFPSKTQNESRALLVPSTLPPAQLLQLQGLLMRYGKLAETDPIASGEALDAFEIVLRDIYILR